MASHSDHELVNEIRLGNRRALGELFDQYSPGLYEFIYRLIGDRDQTARLLEELFISVPLTIGELTENDSVVGWLYAQARESALTFLRQKSWLDALPPSDEPSVSGLAGDIWHAARAMPAFHRAVLVVEELLGLSPMEKAHALSVARTDLPRLVEESRRSFEYQFDLQARQFGRPLAAQIDPERIWGMHRRLGDIGSLFGYLPAFVLPESLAGMIRNKVLTAARMPAPQAVQEPAAPHAVAVVELPNESVVIPAEPRSVLSGCSWPLVGLALLVALVITVGAVVIGMFLTRDTTGPVIPQIQPADNVMLNFISTPGAQTMRVVITAAYRDDRGIDPRATHLVVDGRDVTTQAISTTLPVSSTISYGADLESGPHVVLLQLADTSGNKTSRTWQFTIAGPPTPTATPTLTPTATAVPTATRTPTPTRTATPIPVPNIVAFSATQTTIQRGQTVLLTWSVANADIVFLNQDKVDPSGNRMVAPTATTVYHLIANNAGGTVERSITITVQDLPDLIVRDISLTPSNQIGFVVRNDGIGDAPRPFLIQVTANGVVIYSDRPISALPAGQEAGLIVPNYSVVGTQTISVRVNVLQEIQESNSGNNELVRTLNGPPPTPTNTPTNTPTFTPTFTPSPTNTPTPTFTPTFTPSPGIVSSSVATVNPTVYSGSCPATFSLTATISMTGPGTVTYRWERSDGSNLPPTSISFTAAGTQTVYDQWTSAPLGTFWERLHVGAPNDVLSNQATFTNNCK